MLLWNFIMFYLSEKKMILLIEFGGAQSRNANSLNQFLSIGNWDWDEALELKAFEVHNTAILKAFVATNCPKKTLKYSILQITLLIVSNCDYLTEKMFFFMKFLEIQVVSKSRFCILLKARIACIFKTKFHLKFHLNQYRDQVSSRQF